MFVMRKKHLRNTLIGILLLGLALPNVVFAKKYRVDVLVFLNTAGVANEEPMPTELSMIPTHGLDPKNTEKLAASGITILPSSHSILWKAWDRLRNSLQFKPLLQLSWIQRGRSSGTPLRIQAGPTYTLPSGQTVDAISGYIALFTGTFLYLKTKLTYTENGPKETPSSYLINEIRRVKFDKLQYVDSPKLGILAQVTKIK